MSSDKTDTSRERIEEGTCCGAEVFTLSDPVFEAVGVPALFAAQVNEVVCGSGAVLGGHVPHDAERVAGDLTNLDITGGGESCVHFGHLPINREIKEDS